MRRIHLPVWLDSAAQPRAGAFLVLFTLEGWCRGSLLTIIPLEAHRLLGDAQSVSLLYFFVSIAGLSSTMVIPLVVHVIKRRWAFTLGACLLISAVILFGTGHFALFAVGLLCQVVATAFLEIVMNLYVLDHVPRKEVSHFEPKRLMYAAIPFTVGPWLGVWIAERVGLSWTYMAVAISTFVMLGYFWFLRINENPSVTAPLKRPPSPIRYFPRFFGQPRLGLAWLLAVGRTGWWIMFFVYSPIFLTEQGFAKEDAALIVSIGVVPMLLATFWGAVGRKKGIRFLLVLGYAVTGLATIAIAATEQWPLWAAGFIVFAAFTAVMIDGAGNVPFMRAVHPYERAEMTSVFVTFRHTAQLAMPGLFAGVLTVFPLSAVFVAGGCVGLCMSFFARYLPKRL